METITVNKQSFVELKNCIFYAIHTTYERLLTDLPIDDVPAQMQHLSRLQLIAHSGLEALLEACSYDKEREAVKKLLADVEILLAYFREFCEKNKETK